MTMIKTRTGPQLRVKDWGAGRPVVMVHGWPLSADTFDVLAEDLVRHGYRAVAYDRRGFGGSDQPGEGYDYDTLSDDLADVLTALDLHDVTLIGFSMGGGEVARYMSRHQGHRVVQAVLIASVVPYLLRTHDHPDGVDQSEFDKMAAGIRDDRCGFWEGFFKDFYGDGVFTHPVAASVRRWSEDQAMRAGQLGVLQCLASFSQTDFRPDLTAFRVPTLILHGTGDRTVPISTSARHVKKALPDATLVEYEGAPHGLLVTHARQVRNDLIGFLGQAVSAR